MSLNRVESNPYHLHAGQNDWRFRAGQPNKSRSGPCTSPGVVVGRGCDAGRWFVRLDSECWSCWLWWRLRRSDRRWQWRFWRRNRRRRRHSWCGLYSIKLRRLLSQQRLPTRQHGSCVWQECGGLLCVCIRSALQSRPDLWRRPGEHVARAASERNDPLNRQQ